MKFHIVIERDDEGRYVAECTDLPGCLSEGEILEEALENINEAIIGCMKSRLKLAGEKLKIEKFDASKYYGALGEGSMDEFDECEEDLLARYRSLVPSQSE